MNAIIIQPLIFRISEDDYTLQTACDNAAKEAIIRALDKTGGNNDQAIKLLNISRGTYYSLKKRLRVEFVWHEICI
jgi:transcriptional regulator of acetoin/glycerol metabolism